MKRFSTQREETSQGAQRLWIWAEGEGFYIQKLAEALPDSGIAPQRGARARDWSWCASALAANLAAITEIEGCLQVFNRTLFIESSLDECFALGWHSKSGGAGKPALTTLGQWVNLAKSYDIDPDSAGSLPVAGLIAEQMIEFVHRHPLYRNSDGIVAALPSNPEKAFDLPRVLAQTVSEDCGVPFLNNALRKTRRTAQMKYCLALEEKLDNLSGSVSVVGNQVDSKSLILIDDILESGVTLNEMARALREGGTERIYGLVATKTLKRHFR